MTYQVAVIGAGNPDQPDRYAMAYRHAGGYRRLADVELVACADIVRENAVAFAESFDIDESNVYEDHEAMLSAVQPDIVSVCTPPTTHADIVTDCADSGVAAIHCEKPMAGTWQECREMVAACDRAGVQLTFNHQRRFAAPYTKAKALLDDGRVGALQRVEIGGNNLYDYGSHLFDMAGYMTDQTPIEWVLGQVDSEETEMLYGLPQEREGLAHWRHESGVDGVASTGETGVVRCELRLVGEDGVIEVGAAGGPPLRLRGTDDGWRRVKTGRDGVWRAQAHPLDGALQRVPVGPDRLFGDPPYVERAISDVVSALREGEASTLAAENALQTTEIIFAIWESARRGGRVTLPLDIEDNPLAAMVENSAGGQSDAAGIEREHSEAKRAPSDR
jgi:predicted dehydrogenase